MILHAHITALTDVGRVRRNNEDCFAYDEATGIGVVCDGMGGMAAGEIASSVAAESCLREFALRSTTASTELRLALAIRAANAAVLAASHQPERQGMGTTLVAAVLDGTNSQHPKLLIGNVGDSRAYLLRGEECRQISRDHSYLAELLGNAGSSTAGFSIADRQCYESLITRAIGAAEEVEPEFFHVPLEPGDRILLTSDGLTRYLQNEDISRLAVGTGEAECRQLVRAANDAGGIDNITCLILEFSAA